MQSDYLGLLKYRNFTPPGAGFDAANLWHSPGIPHEKIVLAGTHRLAGAAKRGATRHTRHTQQLRRRDPASQPYILRRIPCDEVPYRQCPRLRLRLIR